MPIVALDRAPVTALNGVGTSLARTLAKLNIATLQDLLFHLPLRYLDRTRITPIADLSLNIDAVVQGQVMDCRLNYGRRRSLQVTVADSTGRLTLRFYHFTAAQQKQFDGAWIRCFGEPRPGPTGVEFFHPEYELAEQPLAPLTEPTLTPCYPLTEGLSQARLRKLVQKTLAMMATAPPEELLPAEVNGRFGVESMSQALHYVHFPPQDAPMAQLHDGRHPYQQRLAFEELLAHHLALLASRQRAQREQAPALVGDIALLRAFWRSLPFPATAAQNRVGREIAHDLSQPKPMLRLVQGDVGSGKTVVAAAAALTALSCGYQAALVAPTEILAEQHYHNLRQWFEPLGFQTRWLSGKTSPAQRRGLIEDLVAGTCHLLVGTHALFQEDVQFLRLGLVIIDEQHRFGVHQRLKLREKSRQNLRPHQLVMTATPIPRTLAMTAYADLDLSVIDELPPGRSPVNTVLISQQRREHVIARVREACARGQQAYWVCTLVEDSETLSASAAEDTAQQLRTSLPDLRIGLIHGRMKSRDKEREMAAFKAGDSQLLVATTVIEVGVDVPNATLMIIENPERLGLAQLHQLRGRVGRGQASSHCVLLYGHPLSQLARKRLQVLKTHSDGFAIAEHDLRIRGPGELLGTRQTGALFLRLADIQRDAALIPDVHALANHLQVHQPATVEKIVRRWFAHSEQYTRG